MRLVFESRYGDVLIDALGCACSRNATINEDANCTHYLDDAEPGEHGEQGEHERGAESTEDEGEGDGELETNGFEGEDFCKDHESSYQSPKPEIVSGDAASCDVYGDQPGTGRPPETTCWCAEDD